jgi:hypothetical protein
LVDRDSPDSRLTPECGHLRESFIIASEGLGPLQAERLVRPRGYPTQD